MNKENPKCPQNTIVCPGKTGYGALANVAIGLFEKTIHEKSLLSANQLAS